MNTIVKNALCGGSKMTSDEKPKIDERLRIEVGV